MSPLVPTAYDAVASGVTVVAAVLVIAALISLVRRGSTLAGRRIFFWVLFIVLVPIVGATSWFVIGRQNGHTRAHSR